MKKTEEKIKVKNFSNETSITIGNFSIETFMEEIIAEVTKNYEFDNRDESKLKACFGLFRLSAFWGKEQNQQSFIQKVRQNLKALDWKLNGRIQTCR